MNNLGKERLFFAKGALFGIGFGVVKENLYLCMGNCGSRMLKNYLSYGEKIGD